MSKVLTTNYVDTPIPGVTGLNLARGLVNFGADFKVKKDSPDEVILTNLTCPVIYPEKIRFSVSDVNNVYTGSSIEPSLFAPTKRGTSILCQVVETWKVTDSTDPSYEVALPVSAHLVLKVPNNEMITPAAVQTLVGRLISGLFETGATNTTRLSALLRGSLKPSDV